MQELGVWALATIGVKWLVYACSLVAAGSAWFLASQPALDASTRRSTARVAAGVALIGIVALILRLCVQAGRLINESWRGMLDRDMLAIAMEGPLGASTVVRLAGFALLLALPLCRRGYPLAIPLAGGVLVAFSFVLTGHSTAEPRAVLAMLLGIHLIVASFWVGALWPLYRLAGEAAQVSGIEHVLEAGDVSDRFGRQAAWTVALLVAVGVALAWYLLGSLAALFGSTYGRTLLVKVGFVAALLGLAAINKWRLAPALHADEPIVRARAARTLRRSIGVESLLFLAVTLATAVLTSVTMLPEH